MRSTPSTQLRSLSPRALLGGLIALLVLLGGAASAQASYPSAKVKKHHCPCAERCKGASCCCPSDALDEPAKLPDLNPAEIAAQPAPLTKTNPCMRSRPCGQPDMPEPTSARPITRLAALGIAAMLPPVDVSRSLEIAVPVSLPALIASRIDDPPEAAAVA